MMYIANLHIHSRFSRATSRDCDLPHLDWWAGRKGIGLLGTGDFTHPGWRKELEEELRKAENEAERIKEAEARLSKGVSELEKSLEDQRRERREICGAAANVHLYAQLGGEKAASRELKGILQVIAKESRKIAERMDA